MRLDDKTDWSDVARWCGGHLNDECTPDVSNCTLLAWSLSHGVHVPTREGWMLAKECFWVVNGVLGEFYPVDPDVFDVTYIVMGEVL